jgi:ATP-dependent RNA helicase DDX5/DBP2
MGFFPQIREICSYLPSTRQSMFFSATWPQEVEKLGNEVCYNSPVKIKIGSEDLTLNNSITQHVEFIYDSEKRDRLFELFREINDSRSKIIIFMRTKKSCDRLVRSLEYDGYRALSLHGDKPQNVNLKFRVNFKL